MNRLALSQLRPCMPAKALQDSLGAAWQAPGPKDLGYVSPAKLDFYARLNRDGHIGQLSYYGKFPPKYLVEGLHLGQALANVLQLYPHLQAQPLDDGQDDLGIFNYTLALHAKLHLALRFRVGHLIGFDLFDPFSQYDEQVVWQPAAPGRYPAPQAERAFGFACPNLKLVVLDSLMEKGLIDLGTCEELAEHVMGRLVNLEDEGWDLNAQIYDYLLRYPLPPELLSQVTTMGFDGGSGVYRFVWYHWDGESDAFEVSSLEGIAQCQQLRSLDFVSMTQNHLDLKPLLGLPLLQDLELGGGPYAGHGVLLQLPTLQTLSCFQGEVEDTALEKLKAAGVKVYFYE